MKKIILSLIAGTLLFSACKKDDNPENQPVDVAISLSYKSESYQGILPLEGVSVSLTRVNTGTAVTAESSSEGDVSFLQLSPGSYDIMASITLSAAQVSELTGINAEEDVTFNASLPNTAISVGQNLTFSLSLEAGRIGDLVIKQIYYAGSHATNGASYRDQFIEIYNNSDQVVYADALYIAEIFGNTSNSSTYIYQSNGQYDWSQSPGMPSDIDANNDYVYVRTLLKIPGNGTQYPIQPGGSIVLASTALNHKAPYTDINGNTISINDPDLTVDLSGADFEAYYANVITTNPLNTDIDNPEVPNVEVLRYYGSDLILSQTALYSYAIFKAPSTNYVEQLPTYYMPRVDGAESGNSYLQLPDSILIDGVQLQSSTTTLYPPKFATSIDAGSTAVPSGARSSESVIRKTAKTINGRIVLQDTNNSSSDFISIKAEPKAFAQ